MKQLTLILLFLVLILSCKQNAPSIEPETDIVNQENNYKLSREGIKCDTSFSYFVLNEQEDAQEIENLSSILQYDTLKQLKYDIGGLILGEKYTLEEIEQVFGVPDKYENISLYYEKDTIVSELVYYLKPEKRNTKDYFQGYCDIFLALDNGILLIIQNKGIKEYKAFSGSLSIGDNIEKVREIFPNRDIEVDEESYYVPLSIGGMAFYYKDNKITEISFAYVL